MGKFLTALAFLALAAAAGCAGRANSREREMTNQTTTRPAAAMPPLTQAEKHVIEDKGTERPFVGKYTGAFDKGTYVCRKCGAPLYRSEDKFKSDCGWPAFDDEIPGAVKRNTDADGRRTEILCANCGGHLGHVFAGEGYTKKNTRHCVNSISMLFIHAGQPLPGDAAAATRPASGPATQRAVFAGGCFWGVEHLLQAVPGVISATSGYTGGTLDNPTYKQVCTGRTAHAEAVEVVYDPSKVTYEQLAKRFFEIHDPTQLNRQGPDTGTQYRSAVFYADESQKQAAEKLLARLRELGYNVVTRLEPAGKFWPAEDYHQDYLAKHPERRCHLPVPRFDKPAK
jgi:peptide methionine sulfoxide reductase msrA/msrB